MSAVRIESVDGATDDFVQELDTCKGSAAEKLYTSLGWVRVGEIPHHALNPDRSPCDTVFFYKQL
jgi:hypothetical protein